MCLNSKHILEVTFIEKLSSYINLNKLKGGRIMFKTYSMELAGRPLTIETGKFAGLANADVVVRYGETVVMVNVTASKEPRDGIDFFPLSVDYEEKMYAVGKIPGGFTRREGKAADKAILVSRAIDRPIRPLFPKDFRNDVVVVATVLSVEPDNSPEVCAMIGTSAALSISDIPFGGPTASVKVGYVDGKFVINPTLEERAKTELDLTVAGTIEKIAMIEAGAKELPDDKMLEAIKTGHEEIKKVCKFISDIKADIGKPKMEYKSFEVDHDIYEEIEANFEERMYNDVQALEKEVRDKNMEKLSEDVTNYFIEKYGEERAEEVKQDIADSLYKLEKKSVRKMIFEEHKRPDGRAIDEIRPLSCEVGLLPRVHGSGLFTRGQTQVLSVATLGMKNEEQILDGLDEEESKRYMHHYNFPAYSVGEARPSRGPGRREIGHGALAERALIPVLPSKEEFPYAIRVVSEVLSSNGSTSQGSVCGSTLSLLDAGVPLKDMVAGIAMGLIKHDDKVAVLSDIQGMEDHLGDMDFKVAGTEKGITAIQMDIKIAGIDEEILRTALAQARVGRLHILNEMRKTIDAPRPHLSKYAPKIITMNINPDKIRDVIGPGGKVITKIIDETGVKIDIEQTGEVFISGIDQEMIDLAQKKISDIVAEVEVGQVYKGKVTRILNFGAFVELLPGKEGLLHISHIAHERVNKVEDVLNIGDEVEVKVTEIDEKGRVNVSRKALLPKPKKDHK